MLKRLLRVLVPEPPGLFYQGGQDELVRRFLAEAQDEVVLNVGAGRKDYGKRVVNLDIRSTPGVHVRADARLLPFRGGAFRFVLCESLLEHVRRPEQAVAEVARVLAGGGRFLAIVSFMTPFHAERGTQEDYQRYTVEGLRHLFRDFCETQGGPAVGPASALCLHTQFFLASLASLGSERLFYPWMRLLGWVLWPMKYLDRWLLRRSNAHVASADLFWTGRKPGVAKAQHSCGGAGTDPAG
jgi:SAM-dependent methyltransferase